MELTADILTKNGFENNHPERVLPKFYLHGSKPEFRIMVDTEYHALSNKLGYNISCWKCDDRGVIIKRSSVSTTNVVEDLQGAIDLCDIGIKIITE